MQCFSCYLQDLGVDSQFESDTAAQGEAKHGDPAAEDPGMLLQDFDGLLQQVNTRKTFLTGIQEDQASRAAEFTSKYLSSAIFPVSWVILDVR